MESLTPTQRLLKVLYTKHNMRYQDVARELGVSTTAAWKWHKGLNEMHRVHGKTLVDRMQSNTLTYTRPEKSDRSLKTLRKHNRAVIARRDERRCGVCLHKYDDVGSMWLATIYEGAERTIDNSILICRACVGRKGNADMDKFLEYERERVGKVAARLAEYDNLYRNISSD